MNAKEFSHGAWARIAEKLSGLRYTVYVGLEMHGPCTTRSLAEKLGVDLLTVRPRVTELCELGLARLSENQPAGHEGMYEAIKLDAAMAAHEKARHASGQMELRLGA